MTTKVSDERLRELVLWSDQLAEDAYNDADKTSQDCFDYMQIALRELQEKRALMREVEAELERIRDMDGDESADMIARALLARVREETT